jgi:hypothetical protein
MSDGRSLLVRRRADGLLEAHEVAWRSGVQLAFVQHLVQIGVIEPAPEAPEFFYAEVPLRVRRIARYEDELAVGPMGAAIILDLLDRIERLEAELAEARRRR